MIANDEPVRFLLVDDLEENLLSLDALLRREGLILLKARSGKEALELLLTHDVGLALLDVQMPEMDGFELAEVMRSTERTRRIPIMFLTAGNPDWNRRFRGYDTGAVDFLHKPIEPDILRSKTNTFFELSRQRQQLAHQRDELKASADENAKLLEESRQYAAALKEADRRKDEFLATLAHELRNPLAPVRNGLQVLRMSPAADVSEKVRDMMDRQLTHLVRLIDDLLDVSRVSEGKINLHSERVRLKDVLDAAIEASTPYIDAGKHTLRVVSARDDLWLDGDLTRLAQTVSNLLNNAAKYTPDGGTITLEARLGDDDVSIIVADTGSGIPTDMLPKVFELFTQVNQSLERAQGGLGIGLALAQRLVTMHGGQIKAESPGLGLGSTFTISLPIAASAPAPQPLEPEPDFQTNARPLNVLVVDDNVASAKTMGWMLELINHTPTLAHDGLEAVAVAKERLPEVIILDIGLPNMNGYDVCRELRKDPRFKNVIILALTGWGQAKDRQLAREAGFNHHLVKPVKFEDFSLLMTSIQDGTYESNLQAQDEGLAAQG